MNTIVSSLAILLLAAMAAGSEPRGLKPPRYGLPLFNVASGFSLFNVASGFSRKIDTFSQTAPSPVSAPTGNATRGKMLFDKTLRCYACHGFDGQTGNPRLVPMARTEDAFITYLRKPGTPAMPAFADVPRQDLIDVYAYIKSLKVDAPAADSIPLLRDIIQRSTKP